MKIIIVGCGKVGYTLAETLSDEGHAVSAIDSNDEVISKLSPWTSAPLRATAAVIAPCWTPVSRIATF